MKCAKCGRRLRIGDEFCSKCGTAIEPDIIYEDRDVREEHTKAYRPYRGSSSDDYSHSKQKQYDYDHEFSDDTFKENEHDITGTVNLDYEDTRAKKASTWTSKGIIAAIGIAAAFVVAIIVVNVQNAIKPDDDVDVGEAAQTTVSDSIRETTEAADETKGSSWKNPFESLFPSQQEDSSASSKGEDSSYSDNNRSDNSSYGYEGREQDASDSYEDHSSGSENNYGQREDSSETQYYESNDENEEYTDIYGDDNSYYGGSVGEDVREFFEDIGGRIRDTAGEYGDRLDESINEFGDRLWNNNHGRGAW